MPAPARPVLGVKIAAYVAVAAAVATLWLDSEPQRIPVTLLVAVFTALLPMSRAMVRLPAPVVFGLLLVEGCLITAVGFLTVHPTVRIILLLVVIPNGARLPRRFSAVCYGLFPLFVALPSLIEGRLQEVGPALLSLVPAFVAAVAFGEGFWKLRTLLEENTKLLDELVAAQKQLHPEPTPTPKGPFTRREAEVLVLVAKGFTNKEIADRLFLAEGTVKNRVSSILEKIQVKDRTQAALRARELGVI
jgi:DNA-binding CsgD family transcriptional regulator